MFEVDRWNEIISALKKNKMRSMLTAFGVFWGIFMLIIMAGAGKGLENGVTQGVGKFATNSFFMWTNNTGKPYKGFLRGRRWNFTIDDVYYIKASVPELDKIAPRIFGGWFSGNNTVRGIRTGSFNVKGDFPEYFEIDQITIIKGRGLNQVDIDDQRKVCVIGEKVAEEMFTKDENPIGEYLRISGVYYQVVGVLHPETNVNMNGRSEESIFLPFTTMLQTYNLGNQVHIIAATAKDGYSASVVEDKVLAIVKERHSIAPDDEQAVMHINIEKQFTQFSMLFLGIQILTWIVGIGTLLAGVIGVSNIMLVIVKERTKEIGIMRAIGATPNKIIGQIMMESIFLTTIAGYFGLLLGVGLLELISKGLEMSQKSGGEEVFFMNPGIDIKIAVGALFVLIISGLIAGLLPAKKATQIKPIDALRAE